ncbi:MAG: signal peptidase I [Paracoccaceae bacterium]|nr:signal peptidase I [Paracoccaceae bacterium]MDE3240465.1 signal peptidase I [Paracoccaceae bacterium]
MARKEKKEEGIVETIKTVVYALLIAGVFRTLFFQPFWIPSGSMKDTLLVGDYIVINKMAYGYSAVSCPFSACPISGRIFGSLPKRGDVVVFRHPASNEDLIKRVIGLPGDTVQMKAGQLYINGTAVKTEPAGTFSETYAPQGPQGDLPRCENGAVGEGAQCLKSRFRETLPGGKVHDILNIEANGQADNTPLYTVPKGHLFVMGDNRDNSLDSRFPVTVGGVGMLPVANLIGRADMIIFSSAGRSLFYFWTWRADRFFKWID